MPALVVIESPYSGDIPKNVEYALECLHDSYFNRGEAPIASHLLYTRLPQSEMLKGANIYHGHVIDNGIAARHGRDHGIKCGDEWALKADLVAVYTDHGISSGMQHRIDFCKKHKIPVEYRTIKSDVMVYGLVGRAGSGKDSLVSILKDAGPRIIDDFACADALKKGCSVLFGIPIDHFYDRKLKETVVPQYNMTPRKICQWMGTEVLRDQVSKSFHVDRLKMDLNECINDGNVAHRSVAIASDKSFVIRNKSERADLLHGAAVACTGEGMNPKQIYNDFKEEFKEVFGKRLIFVTDIRFPEEAQMIRDLGGKLIYVDADKRLGPLPVDAHDSERHIVEIGNSGDDVIKIENNGSYSDYVYKVKKIFN
jgi:hypothetical protein